MPCGIWANRTYQRRNLVSDKFGGRGVLAHDKFWRSPLLLRCWRPSLVALETVEASRVYGGTERLNSANAGRFSFQRARSISLFTEAECGLRMFDECNDISDLNTVTRHQSARNMLVEQLIECRFGV